MSRPDFWSRPGAKNTAKYLDSLRSEFSRWQSLDRETKEAVALAQTAIESDDSSVRTDLEKKLHDLERQFADLEFLLLLSGKHDQADAILAIHAGTGGTDAQDWAGLLLRMYLRFADRSGWTTEIVDRSAGQEAGVKSATVEIHGRYAYGYLKAEVGVHRLVRISPFDAEAMRHTSFALVEVLPVLEEIKEVQIDPKDLRIDTFLSSGHGGQSVNTTYSAVRVVHLPTKITVSCQNERSQTQNKETALKILKAKLHQRFLDEQEKEKQELRGEYAEAAWGNQIRSYVLHPYKLVKDHRTKFESKNPQDVLDGHLDAFIEAYLKSKAQRRNQALP